MKRLVFLGAPGAGKGTQAIRISKKYMIPQISTGDILREAVKEKSLLGQKADSFMRKGKLVPDDVVIGIIEERLKSSDCKKGFILDGFPRTLAQAEALDQVLDKGGMGLDLVIDFRVPEENLVKRLYGRRVCLTCGANYNIFFSPPTKQMVCNKCGGELYQRKDDQEDIIRNRLKVYLQQTVPLIKFYKNKKILLGIDGTGDMNTIFEKLTSVLEGKGIDDNLEVSSGD